MLSFALAGIALGTITEALAYALSLWWYRRAWLRLPNILLVFGVVYGGLAFSLQGQWLLQCLIGAVLGVAYEVMNDRWLRWWHFPGDPWTALKGQPAVIGVGLSWGLVAPIITVVTMVFA